MTQQSIRTIDKYKHCLRIEVSKKYLDDFDNAVVLGDAFLGTTYMMVFSVEEDGENKNEKEN